MPHMPSPGAWLRRLVVPVLLVGLMLVVPGTAQAQSCSTDISSVPGAGADFDGDNVVDLAIGDPDATVAGKALAGQVHIAYGDGAKVTIDADDIASNENGAGERFGFTLDTVDWNGDGCSDLFIGAPFETWASGQVETGIVVFIPGSPSGLDTALAENWSQASFDGDTGVDANEPGDRFGWDIAAGLDIAGDPYLVVGVPGESTGTTDGVVLEHGGNVFYARPGNAVDFNQNSAGYADSFEDGDMFGYSVAASESGFVVGVPGESAEKTSPALDINHVGTVFLIGHNDASTAPTPITAWGQDSTGITGGYETGDMYGYSLDMVDYIPAGGTSTRMMIAVGAPGESLAGDDAAGMSMVMWSPGTGIAQYKTISQDRDKVAADATEPGDALGAAVAMVNRTPKASTSTDTLLLAVGSPGEDTENSAGNRAASDVGEVGLYSMVEAESAGGDPIRELLVMAGADLAEGAAIGSVLHSTTARLFLTVRTASGPAVYSVPWLNIVNQTYADVSLVADPSDFGMDTADSSSFGRSLA
ncbi:integrin alpha [Glycomyces sp. NPDC047369]